jgi:hypothetical protein
MAAPEIPQKQKAVIYDQPGSVSTKVVEIDVPEPGDGEVLINLFVNYSIRFYKMLIYESGLIPASATQTLE